MRGVVNDNIWSKECYWCKVTHLFACLVGQHRYEQMVD